MNCSTIQIPFPLAGSELTKLVESYPALDVAIVAAQIQTISHPLDAVDRLPGMALQLAHQLLLIQIIKASTAFLTADSQNMILLTSDSHTHQTLALDVACKLAPEFELIGSVGVDFLVVEVGEDYLFALGQLDVVDFVVQKQFAGVLVSAQVDQVDPTLPLVQPSCNQAFSATHVLCLPVRDAFKSRTMNSVSADLASGYGASDMDSAPIIKNRHLAVTETNGSDPILEATHLIDHLQLAVPNPTEGVVSTRREDVAFGRQAKHQIGVQFFPRTSHHVVRYQLRVRFAIHSQKTVSQILQIPNLSAQVQQTYSFFWHEGCTLDQILEHTGQLEVRGVVRVSEEQREGLDILHVQRQMVFEDVERLLHLVFPDESLDVHVEIIVEQLLLLLVVSALGQNGADVLVYRAGLLNPCLLPQYVRGVREPQTAKHPANIRSLSDTWVTTSILRSC